MNTQSTNQSKKKYIIAAIIIVVAVAGAFFISRLSGGVNVKNKYAGNIAMIHNSYVYKVWFSDSSIGEMKFIKTEDGNFVPFDEEKMKPNEMLAVGLVIHENGTCITSSKAVYPWMDNNDQEALRQTAQEICDYQKSLGNDIYFQLTGGESISLNMYSRISKGRDKVEMTECVPVESSEAAEQNIGLLKPKGYAIPYEYATIDLNGVKEEEMNEGDLVSMLAVDDGAFSNNGEPVALQKGKITNKVVSSNIWYDFENKFISEGAPVFDKKGRLIAINTILSDDQSATLIGKKIGIKESIADITKKNLQQEINRTMEIYNTITEVEKAQKSMDSIMKNIDTIGQSLFHPEEIDNIINNN